ncbi:hypothetical protein OB920_07765 [Halobacteria archaeon HArc-gm2]|nr:hypothetical protein [Halobacteria archaeon HArc-gm2]
MESQHQFTELIERTNVLADFGTDEIGHLPTYLSILDGRQFPANERTAALATGAAKRFPSGLAVTRECTQDFVLCSRRVEDLERRWKFVVVVDLVTVHIEMDRPVIVAV